MNPRCRGVSLVIVLLLLAGVMLLAVSGLGGAIASMALADLDERAARAFEAAEAGVTRSLVSGVAVSPAAAPWPATDPAVTVLTLIRHDPPPPAPPSPYGFSFGSSGTGFVLHHGSVLAEGSAGRGTLVRIEQGFAVVGPARESAP
jgi:hypothetical protein